MQTASVTSAIWHTAICRTARCPCCCITNTDTGWRYRNISIRTRIRKFVLIIFHGVNRAKIKHPGFTGLGLELALHTPKQSSQSIKPIITALTSGLRSSMRQHKALKFLASSSGQLVREEVPSSNGITSRSNHSFRILHSKVETLDTVREMRHNFIGRQTYLDLFGATEFLTSESNVARSLASIMEASLAASSCTELPSRASLQLPSSCSCPTRIISGD